MSAQLGTIFKLGVFTIWIVAFFWFVFFSITFFQDLGLLYLVIAIGALFMGSIAHYFWRRVLGINPKTRHPRKA